MTSKKIPFDEIDVWKHKDKAKEMLQRTNGARSIPQILIGDQYVGGNQELQEANRNGLLEKLLKD